MIRNIFSGLNRRRLSLAAVLVVALAGSAAAAFFAVGDDFSGTTGDGHPPAFRGGMEAFRPNDPPRAAPDVAFTDAAGHRLSLADFRGKVVLLNFWATWCGPCVKEMPSLDRLQAKLGGDRFTVVAVSVDRQGLDVVRPFLARTAVQNLTTYLDPHGDSMRTFGIQGLPTSFIIDRTGHVAGRLEGGANWDTPEAEALMRYYIGPALPPATRADATR